MKATVLFLVLVGTAAAEIPGVTQEDVTLWDFDFISRDYGQELWTVYDYEACE